MSIISLQFSIITTLLICISKNNNVEGKIVKHVFEVKYFNGTQDGVYKEKIIGINGQFPGPIIETDVGDILEIDVINSIQDGQNTTIHWHGIHQKKSHCEDGTSQISQCPLRNGYTQRYRFQINQTGTYWYHSHVKSQYTEGLWGTLLVHNKPEVYTYDEEILITLNDWYHRTAKENEDWHISPASRGVPPYPESGLINGFGRYNCSYATLQNRTCDPSDQRRPVFKVQRNKAYRIRVINTSAIAAFNFSIDGHPLQIIEVDGTDVVNTAPVDIVSVAAAQRYSFILHTTNPTDRYLIRADMRTDMMVIIAGANINQYPESLMPNVTAILEYNNDPSNNSSTPIFTTEPHTYLDEVPQMSINNPVYLDQNTLSPFDGINSPSYFNQEFTLIVDFYEDFENIRRGSFNRTPFVLPDDKPLLMSFLDGNPLPVETFPLTIEHMNVIQLVINNDFLGPHPLHLHGHSFWVLGSGGRGDGDFDPSRHNLTLTGARRDTVLIEEYSWTVIRFIADNPGLWTFHCHIDWHNLSGMALVFVEAPEQARNEVKFSEEAQRVCKIWED